MMKLISIFLVVAAFYSANGNVLPIELLEDQPDSDVIPIELFKDSPTGDLSQDEPVNDEAVFADNLVTPSPRQSIYDNQDDSMYQGDIVLTPEQKTQLRSRNAMVDLSKRWTDGVVPYKISTNFATFNQTVKDVITKAVEHIKTATGGCIKYVPWTNQKDYVLLQYGTTGCWSHLGRTGNEQPIVLDMGCWSVGTVVHEMLHAVGFQHEQNRPDRDNYLNIYWDKIIPEKKPQFELAKGLVFNTPFDFKSIMLYGETAFSKDKKTPTMLAKDPKIRFPDADRRDTMSPTDIYEVKQYYGCK